MGPKSQLEQKALKLCSTYLGGPWKSEENFKVEVLNGGLTNKLYICSTRNNEKEYLKVILRIYGLIMQVKKDELLRKQDVDAQITESVVFAVLGTRGLGPKLHGAFPDGRLEEYIPGRNLVTKELQDPEISRTIAARLADYHQLHMPMTKDPRLLDQFAGYYNKAKSLGVNMTPYTDIFQHCCQLIKTSKSPILFCHNDVHEGNILIDQRSKDQGNTDSQSLRLIDFEYSAYGYRGFDFSNHFNEWMFDYSNPEWPYYHYNPHDFPTEGPVFQAKKYLLRIRNRTYAVMV
jgi:choline/ethanolamine kinase